MVWPDWPTSLTNPWGGQVLGMGTEKEGSLAVSRRPPRACVEPNLDRQTTTLLLLLCDGSNGWLDGWMACSSFEPEKGSHLCAVSNLGFPPSFFSGFPAGDQNSGGSMDAKRL